MSLLYLYLYQWKNTNLHAACNIDRLLLFKIKPVPGPDDPIDCSDVLASGSVDSSVYVINPKNGSVAFMHTPGPFEVYCDMETDGGGWTV